MAPQASSTSASGGQSADTQRLRAPLLLALAILVPAGGVGIGALLGTPMEQLGGIMLSYWVLAIASLGRAIYEYRRYLRAREGNRRLGWQYLPVVLAGTALGAPIALKLASPVVQLGQSKPLSVLSRSLSGNCRTQLGNPEKAFELSKEGGAGELPWVFCIGNRTVWRIRLWISADDSGAEGTSSVVGYTSPWYSFRPKKRVAIAEAGAQVSCERRVAGCTPVALPGKDTQVDGGFVATVEAVSDERAGGATVQIDVSASVSGGAPIGTLSLGVEKGPAKVGYDLSSPNDAHDVARKSKSYFYRCVKG